ncbi:hypothetical protein IAD21_01038 [Abditibacteriota bacterium]|nr:hypothetical protein IAD21_01038 [Abditibacteriota bacterium]
MTTYFFPGCRMNVHDSGETTAYFSSSGRILERLPRPVEDRTVARFLGYGADTRRFRREHDLLLHTLAVLQGYDCSSTLWSLAHDEANPLVSPYRSDEEEEMCARVHRWLNLDLWSEEIEELLSRGMNKSEVRDFLRAVLEGEITHIEMPIIALAA